MKYYLAISRKFTNSDINDLLELMVSLKAIQTDQVLWEFDSDKTFRDITLDIYHELNSTFDFLIIVADGSENDLLPKHHWTNDTYLRHCIDLRKHEPVEEGLRALLEMSLSFLLRQEARIQKKLSAQN